MFQMLSEVAVTEMTGESLVMEIPYRACKIMVTLLSQNSGGGTVLRAFDPSGVDIVPQFVEGHFAATAANIRRAMSMIDFKLEGFKKAPISGHSS